MNSPRKARLRLWLLPALLWALTFTGWGWGDVAGFFQHPARAALFGVGLLMALVSGLVLKDVPDPFGRGTQPLRRQAWVIPLLSSLMMFVAYWLPYADRRSLLVFAGADWLRYVGVALNLVGASVRLAALHALGRQFSGYVTLQENHRLVQEGPYRLIRHPMYLAGLLALPGWALVYRSWLVLLLAAAFLLFTALRIPQEEKLLSQHFGIEFEAFRRRTWRLLPHIY